MAIKVGPGKASQYARYKSAGTYAANKRRKLQRLMKLQPNNKQISLALESIVSYSRKSPKVRMWNKTKKQEVYILAKFKNSPAVTLVNTKDNFFGIGSRV